MGLQELLEASLNAVAERDQDEQAYAAKARLLIEEQLPDALTDLLGDRGSVNGSIGEGNLASVPWAAVFLGNQKPTATEGTYVVYLFAADGSSVYLTLGQATTNVSGWSKKNALLKRSLDRRAAAGNPPGFLHEIHLKSSTSLGKSYEPGAVLAIEYVRGQVPDDSVLASDFERMLDSYSKVIESGIELGDGREVMHLLLRWTLDKSQDTIEMHDAVARAQGSVWWGKVSGSSSPGMTDSRVEAFKAQIDAGLLTHVYLAQGENAWIAKMLDITTDASRVNDSQRPSYYTKDQCHLFVRLGPITPMTDSLNELLVLETNPQPDSVDTAFKGQGSLFYVYESWRPGMSLQTGAEEGGQASQLQELASKIHWSVEETAEAIESLQGSMPQIVLYGSPGTGKTFVADAFADHLTEGDRSRIQTVQFHPSYGYEDFIEGLRPEADESGNIQFRVVKGHLLNFVDSMKSSTDRYVLIIDELNRANVPKVLGELLYLLEYRGRQIKLMNSGDFSLPANLSIIATMNTADRSTGRLDSALRRRFTFFDCPPSSTALRQFYESGDATCTISDLVQGFQELNNRITEDLDEHHQIGHTFFMEQHLDPVKLQQIWKRQVKPQLADYFYDQPEVLASYSPEVFWVSLED